MTARQISVALLAVLVVVLVRLGFVYWERGHAAKMPAKQRPVAGVPEVLKGVDLKILMFYTSTPVIEPGKPLTVCYGVLNAVSVELMPPLEQITPSLNRCIHVDMKGRRTLGLRAAGKNGEQAEAEFTIGLMQPRPKISFVEISTLTPKRGDIVSLCYGTEAATAVRLAPAGPPLIAGPKECVRWAPATEKVRLIAESAGGRDEVTLPFKFSAAMP